MGTLFRYVALGDSTAAGVGSQGVGYPELVYRRMKSAGWPAGILNLGQSGAVSADLVRTQLERVLSVSPDLVTLGIGGNDLWRLVSPDRFKANLKAIADVLERTDADVIISNLIDLGRAPIAQGALSMMNIPPEVISGRVKDFNRMLGELASRPPPSSICTRWARTSSRATPSSFLTMASTRRSSATSAGPTCCSLRWKAHTRVGGL